MDREEKIFEEQKRDRNWDPVQRWRVFEETIAWLDQQRPVQRNTAQACREKERRILEGMSRSRNNARD